MPPGLKEKESLALVCLLVVVTASSVDTWTSFRGGPINTRKPLSQPFFLVQSEVSTAEQTQGGAEDDTPFVG